MNVRFDNPQNQLTNAPAPIVIDGFEHSSNANAASCANNVDVRNRGVIPFKQTNEDAGVAYDQLCVVTTPASKRISCPLPRDRTMANLGGNSWSTSMIGTGANPTDLLAYWKNHHTGSTIPSFYDTDKGMYVSTTTRWQVYQMENNRATYPSAAFTSDSIESSTPFCRDSTPAGDIKRRLINVAIVDCEYWNIKGSSHNLPVTTLMAEFFMTEPANSNGEIYGELVKTYQVNSAGSNLYHLVELVR
jgi:hypothetical protein